MNRETKRPPMRELSAAEIETVAGGAGMFPSFWQDANQPPAGAPIERTINVPTDGANEF